jgi:hypothetical protein
MHRRIRPGGSFCPGMDGLLAVVADIRRLREVRAGADIGDRQCLEMPPWPLSPQAAASRRGKRFGVLCRTHHTKCRWS